MSDVLSQAEIDALLSCISMGGNTFYKETRAKSIKVKDFFNSEFNLNLNRIQMTEDDFLIVELKKCKDSKELDKAFIDKKINNYNDRIKYIKLILGISDIHSIVPPENDEEKYRNYLEVFELQKEDNILSRLDKIDLDSYQVLDDSKQYFTYKLTSNYIEYRLRKLFLEKVTPIKFIEKPDEMLPIEIMYYYAVRRDEVISKQDQDILNKTFNKIKNRLSKIFEIDIQ